MNGINHAINTGITYHGIGFEELDRDISNLLEFGRSTPEELQHICKELDKADQAVQSLYAAIEKFMPHKNAGNNILDIPGNNRLLYFLFDIWDTATEFRGGVRVVSSRVQKILKGKEQLGLFDGEHNG